jgi:hypothetical protein
LLSRDMLDIGVIGSNPLLEYPEEWNIVTETFLRIIQVGDDIHKLIKITGTSASAYLTISRKTGKIMLWQSFSIWSRFRAWRSRFREETMEMKTSIAFIFGPFGTKLNNAEERIKTFNEG